MNQYPSINVKQSFIRKYFGEGWYGICWFSNYQYPKDTR